MTPFFWVNFLFNSSPFNQISSQKSFSHFVRCHLFKLMLFSSPSIRTEGLIVKFPFLALSMAKESPAVLEELEAQEITHLLKIRNKMPFNSFSGFTGQCQHSLNHMQRHVACTHSPSFFTPFSSLPYQKLMSGSPFRTFRWIEALKSSLNPQASLSTLGVLKHVMYCTVALSLQGG